MPLADSKRQAAAPSSNQRRGELTFSDAGEGTSRTGKSSRVPQIRIALNSTCGRACYYCRPSGESASAGRTNEITEKALINIAHSLKRLGINDLKLTGGDPALWPALERSVHRLKQGVGIRHVQVISRSPRIAVLARGLANAGLDLFNLSIDTLNPALHREITGRSDLPDVLAALRCCVRTGVPCKVNVVVLDAVNTGEIDALVEYCQQLGVRAVKFLDVITDLHQGVGSFGPRLMQIRGVGLRDLYSPLAAIEERFRSKAVSRSIESQGDLGHPMVKLVLPSGLELIFKDANAGRWYGDICRNCAHFPCRDALMALRITPDLKIQFCLLNDAVSIDISKEQNDPIALDEAIGRALQIYTDTYFVVHQQLRRGGVEALDLGARLLGATLADRSLLSRP